MIRLRRLFRLADCAPALYTPLIVLKGSKDPANPTGLLVDAVSDIRMVRADSRLPLSDGHVFNDCVESVVATEGAPVHVLGLDRLLLGAEQVRLEELREIEQQRLVELRSGA